MLEPSPGTALLVRRILTVVFLIAGAIAAFSTRLRRRFRTAILPAHVMVLVFSARSFLSLSILEGLILYGPDLAGNRHVLLDTLLIRRRTPRPGDEVAHEPAPPKRVAGRR